MVRLHVSIAAALLFISGVALGAPNVYLELVVDGEQLEGESTVTSLERGGKIVCTSFRDSARVPMDEATGSVTGRRQYQPIVFTKEIDKTSPRLWIFTAQGKRLTKATFRFYRADPSGSGVEELYYTVTLENVIITSISAVSPDSLDSDSGPPLEEVTFIFERIMRTYEGGVTHQDSWRGEA
jgi:type VI secretion system secreted protein Hcp